MTTPDRDLPRPRTTKRRSSGDQVADYIRRLIFEGELRNGDRVPQDRVAEALALSRIPVREALIALEREGWVTIEMNRGAFVNSLDADAIRDSYEIFGNLYGFAANRALARSDGELIEQLSGLERAIKTCDDPAAMLDLTLTYHGAVVEAARSPRVKVLLRAMTGMVAGNFFEEVPGSMDLERRSMAAIMRAMRQGDATKASLEYVRMMQRQGDLVVKLFEERGLFDVAGPATGRR